MLIKTRLTENQYPTQKTVLTVDIPQLGEKTPEVKVLAANGRTQISDFEIENNMAKIVLSNVQSGNKNIVWNKNGYEEVVITFLYDENVDTSKLEIRTKAETKVYNSDKLYEAIQTQSFTGEEIDNTVMTITEFITPELYKGQLYANTVTTEKEKVKYNTTAIKIQ